MTDEILGEGRYLRLVRRDGWELVERRDIAGIVAIVAVTDEGRLLLVEQHRPPVDTRVIEIPAGLAGDAAEEKGESLVAAARRELLEETGYEAAEMIHLADGTPSAGLTNEVIAFFEARGLRKVGDGGGDESEEIAVHEVPIDRVRPWLAGRMAAGATIDIKLFAALWLIGL